MLLARLRVPVPTKMGPMPRLLLRTPEGWQLSYSEERVAPSVAAQAIANGAVAMTNPPDKSSWRAAPPA